MKRDQKCIALRSSWEREPDAVGMVGVGVRIIVEMVEETDCEKSMDSWSEGGENVDDIDS